MNYLQTKEVYYQYPGAQRGVSKFPLLISAGVHAVRKTTGTPVTQGELHAEKLRPARRDGQPVLFVESGGDHWLPLKLD